MADEPEKQKSVGPDESATTDAPEVKVERVIDLSPGGELTEEGGATLTAAALTRLVLVAGEADSGKTTLLETIYEKFNEGSFADLLFAGSTTLVGWERRCHLARIASGAEKPDTERTLGLQHQLLHLCVRNTSFGAQAQDVLFSDLSGEVFKMIRDSTAECQQLGMLKRADHFVLLLDGRKLTSTATRQEALTNGIALLRSCVDAGMIGLHSFVDVAFSKYDLLAAADKDTSEFMKYGVETITGHFEPSLGRLRFHNIAARPESSDLEYAFGISSLVRSWVDDSPYFIGRLAFPVKFPLEGSEFDNYLRVRFPEYREIRAWK